MTFANPAKTAGYLGDYFKIPGVYRYKMPVWEQAGGKFLFYTESKYWLVSNDYHKNEGYVASNLSGLTQLPLTGWEIAIDEGWKLEAALMLEVRNQAEGHPMQGIETRRLDRGNRPTVLCGGKDVSSCLDCSTCDTDCFTWPQKWSLQKPCVLTQCKCNHYF